MDHVLYGALAATGLIVLLGEVVPQAVCERHALAAGARLAWLMWVLLGLTYVVAAPLALALDKLTG